MVAADVAEIVRVSGSMGLELNTSKSELIAHQELLVNDSTLQSFIRVNVSDASLLGAPIFPGPVLDNIWSHLRVALDRAGDKLRRVSSQDALILLRSCLSAPKVLHILRCSPCMSHPSLQLFDSLLRSALQRICNSDFSDSQWLQASLPARDGGLAVRRVSLLALSAYLVSAASTLSLQNEILSGCAGSEDTFFQTYCCHGRIPLAMCLRLCRRNNLSGIVLALQLTELWLSPTLGHLSNLPRFEPHRRHTVEIGCLRCPYPRVAFV